jgi:NAD(P)-dependent dehydrogenase (short-subunit alcohol dehydrogenase family)
VTVDAGSGLAAEAAANDNLGLAGKIAIVARGNVTHLPIETWRDIWASNVESMILMSKYAIPAMIETADGGSIINIGALRPFGRSTCRPVR